MKSSYLKIKTAEVEDKGGLRYPNCVETAVIFYIPKTRILSPKVAIELCTPDSPHPYSFRTDRLEKIDAIILGLIKARTRFLEEKLREERTLDLFRQHIGFFMGRIRDASESEIEKIRRGRL